VFAEPNLASLFDYVNSEVAFEHPTSIDVHRASGSDHIASGKAGLVPSLLASIIRDHGNKLSNQPQYYTTEAQIEDGFQHEWLSQLRSLSANGQVVLEGARQGINSHDLDEISPKNITIRTMMINHFGCMSATPRLISSHHRGGDIHRLYNHER